MADLRNLMKTALGAGSDAEMLTVLGVRRDEMPEAIKTLQRALERVVEKEGSGGSGISGASVEVEMGVVEAQGQAQTQTSVQTGVEGGEGRGRGRLTGMVRRISIQSGYGGGKEPPKLKRSSTTATAATVASVASTNQSEQSRSSGSGSGEERSRVFVRDTLDREFIETGIDALRRMSNGPEANLSLPSWTITRFVRRFSSMFPSFAFRFHSFSCHLTTLY